MRYAFLNGVSLLVTQVTRLLQRHSRDSRSSLARELELESSPSQTHVIEVSRERDCDRRWHRQSRPTCSVLCYTETAIVPGKSNLAELQMEIYETVRGCQARRETPRPGHPVYPEVLIAVRPGANCARVKCTRRPSARELWTKRHIQAYIRGTSSSSSGYSGPIRHPQTVVAVVDAVVRPPAATPRQPVHA